MTKRWLSLVLVLTLMSSLFTGVAFAAPVPKALVPTVTFVREKAELAVEAGKLNTNIVLGHFLLDGQKLTDGSIANSLSSAVKVGLKAGTETLQSSYVQGDKLYATFTATTAAEKLVVYTESATTTPFDLDMTKAAGKSSEIVVKATLPITTVSAITWNGTLTGIVDVTNPSNPTMLVGAKTDASNNAALYVTISPDQGDAVEDKLVTWTSSNSSIVSVTATESESVDPATDPTTSEHFAKVEALAVGTATITAKAGSFTKTLKITVLPVPGVSVTIKDVNKDGLDRHWAKVGESEQLGLTWVPTNTSDKTGTWAIKEAKDHNGVVVSPSTIASLSSTGLLQGDRKSVV